ncbi:hypothetical protein OPV22_029971 [Ensete ventricosum]|uniref:Uncharacterized protein n=1 Tax=Ensete ventricosum TaxID=4639 RepID=A0AAV8Q8I4_ENSVE|nr:hypothetical protein OPV22_029971 [Ensete ventricosum]
MAEETAASSSPPEQLLLNLQAFALLHCSLASASPSCGLFFFFFFFSPLCMSSCAPSLLHCSTLHTMNHSSSFFLEEEKVEGRSNNDKAVSRRKKRVPGGANEMLSDYAR